MNIRRRTALTGGRVRRTRQGIGGFGRIRRIQGAHILSPKFAGLLRAWAWLAGGEVLAGARFDVSQVGLFWVGAGGACFLWLEVRVVLAAVKV